MKAKYIFIDVDGTLKAHGTGVPDSAVQAIKKARANGHKVFLCTGRNKASITDLLDYGFDGFVASAGGYVEVEGKIIHDAPMSAGMLGTLRKALDAEGIMYNMESTDTTFFPLDMLKAFANVKKQDVANSEMGRLLDIVKDEFNARDSKDYDGTPIHKVCFMEESADKCERALSRLDERYHVVYFADAPGARLNGEVNSALEDKGRGIDFVLDYYGASPEDTIGFGDSMNDLAMIQKVGLSVVMGNGDEKLKAMADVVTESVGEDGLYNEFKRQGLLG